MPENSSFLKSPRVTGRIAPCLQRKGAAQLEAAQPGPEESLGHHIRLSTAMAQQMTPQRLLFTAKSKYFAGKTGEKLVWIPALQDGLVCAVTLEREWLFYQT